MLPDLNDIHPLRCHICGAVVLVLLDDDVPWYDEYQEKLLRHRKSGSCHAIKV